MDRVGCRVACTRLKKKCFVVEDSLSAEDEQNAINNVSLQRGKLYYKDPWMWYCKQHSKPP